MFLVTENSLALLRHSFHIRLVSYSFNKFNTKGSAHYRIVCLYSINIAIFVPMNFSISFGLFLKMSYGTYNFIMKRITRN